jgi:hypothetical protein
LNQYQISSGFFMYNDYTFKDIVFACPYIKSKLKNVKLAIL